MRRTVLVVAGIVAVGAVLAFGSLSYTSVCGQCGLMRDSVSLFGLQHHQVRPTALSKAVEQSQLRVGHAHEWRFSTGVSTTAICIIGPGRHLLDAVGSEHVAAFVRNLALYDPQSVDVWLNGLLGGRSHDVGKMLDTFPEAGFAKREEFDAWRKTTIDGAEEWLQL